MLLGFFSFEGGQNYLHFLVGAPVKVEFPPPQFSCLNLLALVFFQAQSHNSEVFDAAFKKQYSKSLLLCCFMKMLKYVG